MNPHLDIDSPHAGEAQLRKEREKDLTIAPERQPSLRGVPWVWQPDEQVVRQANITRLLAAASAPDLETLHRRAVEDPDWLYRQVSSDLGIEWHTDWRVAVDARKGRPWARWFEGGRLNLAHNCIDRHVRDGFGARVALIGESQTGDTSILTYEALHREVARTAGAMLASGISAGDHVGLFMPMIPEAVIALFACFKVGAVAVPIFSGYGVETVAQRLAQCDAKMLITADGTYRGSKRCEMLPIAEAAVKICGTLEETNLVVVCRLDDMQAERHVAWHAWLAGVSDPPETAHLPAEHPCLIAFTSGSTGRPKGTIHTHSGTQMRMAMDWAYHFDCRRDDVVLWPTDVGWIMAPYLLVGALTSGAAVVLLEGVPNQPEPDRLWRIVQRRSVSILGVSPTLVRMMAADGKDLADASRLASLRILGSSGEAWDELHYQWFSEAIGGGRCPIINASGGTEVGAALLAPYPIEPIKPCSVGRPALGLDLDVVDENGRSTDGIGELVCRNLSPGMTKGCLHDERQYLDSYWSSHPEIWTHGDLAERDADGSWFLRGRSDDTMKIAGKRVGPSEIESLLLHFGNVAQAIAVGVSNCVKGQEIVAFIVPVDKPGKPHNLCPELSDCVARQLGAPFRPAAVIPVTDLPRTRTGKMMRRLVRAICEGASEFGDVSSLVNPECLTPLKSAWSEHRERSAKGNPL